MINATFAIAGIPFNTRVSDERIAGALLEAWRLFRSNAAPRFLVETHCDRARAAGAELQLPEVAIDGERLRLNAPDYFAEFDGRRAVVHGPAERYPLEATVRIVLATLLAKQNALLVHGVGLRHGNNAALFTGQSGAGKSTLGGLCRDGSLDVLADELVAAIVERDRVRVEGTPWNVGMPSSATLRAFGTLGWGAAARLEEVAPSEVLRVAVSNVLLWDPSTPGRARAIGLLGDMLSLTKPVRLIFPRLRETAELLRSALEPA